MSKSSNKSKVETLKLWVEEVKKHRKFSPKKQRQEKEERD